MRDGEDDRDHEEGQRQLEGPVYRAERGQPRERHGHEMPLGHLGQHAHQGGSRLVQRLERGAAPDAVIDARAAPPEQAREPRAVDAARPAHVPRAVVLLRPLALEQCFRAAVPDLLLPIRAHRVPAVMPHHGGGTEAEGPTPLLQAPAHVDVVAGGTELRVESADRVQRHLPERHVAAGDVLSLAITQQHVHRTSRRACDALRDRSIVRRRDVRTTHTGVRAAHERRREVGQPVGVGIGVVVDVRHDVARGDGESRVPGARQPLVRRPNQRAVVAARDGGRPVGRSVVHHDDLVVWVVEVGEPVETVSQRASAVVRAHDHRDARPGHVPRERHVGERFAHRGQGGLGRAVAAREAEVPVFHLRPGAIPRVRPGVYERAGAAGRERRPHLPIEGAGLDLLAIASTIEPDLTHHERPIAGQRLEPGQVRLEGVLGFEVDVVAEEIEEIEPQVLRGRIVHVGDEAVGRLLFGGAIQSLEVALDATRAKPARHGRGDLVAHGIAQHRRMTRAGAHAGTHHGLDVGRLLWVREEPDVTLHGQADHDAEAVSLRRIEQPDRWHAAP